MSNPGPPATDTDYPAAPPQRQPGIVEGIVDANSWILGGVLISRHEEEPAEKCWEDPVVGCFYTVRKAPDPLPTLRPVVKQWPINHLISTCEGTDWEIGKCILSVRKAQDPKRTPHHKTLEALKKWSREKGWTFETPEVYYHGCHNGYYHILYSTGVGAQVSQAWLMKHSDKEFRDTVLRNVAEFCSRLAELRGDTMSGVDGKELVEPYLSDQPGRRGSFTSQELLATCGEIGLDCSTLVFAHNLLSPDNIIVDPAGRVTGVHSWEGAGYVPKDWIRTKFAWGTPFHGDGDIWNEEQKREWTEEEEKARKEKEEKEKGEIEEQKPKVCGARAFEFDNLLGHLLE